MLALKVPSRTSRIEALTGVNLPDLIEQIRLAGEKAARLKAHAEWMEELKKITHNEIIEDERKRIQSEGSKPIESALKSSAYASKKYRDAAHAAYVANGQCAVAQVQHYALRNQYEAAMKEADLNRAEMYLNQIS